jgi:hypothetical protein
MAAAKPEVLYLAFYRRQKQNSKCYLYVFDVGQTYEHHADSRRHRTTPETQHTNTSGLAAAIFRFRCRTMSAGVGLEFIGLADVENIEITFRISLLSIMEREIQVLPVW